MEIRNDRADLSRKFRVGRKTVKAIERHRAAARLVGPDLANRQLLARRQTVENLLGHVRRPQEFTEKSVGYRALLARGITKQTNGLRNISAG